MTQNNSQADTALDHRLFLAVIANHPRPTRYYSGKQLLDLLDTGENRAAVSALAIGELTSECPMWLVVRVWGLYDK